MVYNGVESENSNIWLLDSGKGSVAVKVSGDEIKLIHRVQHVPYLAHNLLSVGQLIDDDYDLNFSKQGCCVINVDTGVQLLFVQKTSNNLFPVEFNSKDQVNLQFQVKMFLFYGIKGMVI